MFWALGFLPCFVVGFVLKKLRLLRIPRQIELAGMDHRIIEQEAACANEIVDLDLEAAREGD